ncbi:unnamed protein product [Ixodes pacificus]
MHVKSMFYNEQHIGYIELSPPPGRLPKMRKQSSSSLSLPPKKIKKIPKAQVANKIE